jgi:hypothetical protein
MSTPHELPPGARFADFTIDGVLGRGGMGVVYRAHQERLSRYVALKVIAPHLTHDAGFRERFRREAAMAAAIDHPSILPIYEAGEFEGQPFLVMRHVAGTDLKTLIERMGRMEPERAVQVCADIAGALDAAHRRGLVHRDVKPANILIGQEDDDEVVYLTDFGLTKGRSDERLTQTGKWVGTVDYMAPEQIEGKEVDGRSDEYALACVLYEALTGAVPYLRDSDVQIMWAHIKDDPPRPSVVRPELGTGLDDVIARAMAKDIDARYPTCREFARAAAEAIGAGARAAAPAPAATPSGTVVGGTLTGDVPPPPPASGPSGGPPSAPGGRSRTPLLIGAGLLAVLIVGVIAALALGGGGDGTDTTSSVAATTPVTAAAPGSSGAAATDGVAADGGVATTGAPSTAAETTPAATTAPEDPTASEPAEPSFPPASAAELVEIAKRPVPFVALYDLIQGGNAGTLLLAYDGGTRIAYRVRLPNQGTVWAAFDANVIQYGCFQGSGVPEPLCTDGSDDPDTYRSLIEEFVNGLLSAQAVETNFSALAATDPPVLPGEMTGAPIGCIQSVGAGTARLCVREDSIITEVTVVEAGKEVGARARRAGPDVTEDDFLPPAPIQ